MYFWLLSLYDSSSMGSTRRRYAYSPMIPKGRWGPRKMDVLGGRWEVRGKSSSCVYIICNTTSVPFAVDARSYSQLFRQVLLGSYSVNKKASLMPPDHLNGKRLPFIVEASWWGPRRHDLVYCVRDYTVLCPTAPLFIGWTNSAVSGVFCAKH